MVVPVADVDEFCGDHQNKHCCGNASDRNVIRLERHSRFNDTDRANDDEGDELKVNAD